VANAGVAWIDARNVWRAEQVIRADELTAYLEARDADQLAALRELLEDGEDYEEWQNS